MSKLFNSLIEVQSFLNIVVQISGERNTIDPSESIHLSDEEYIKQWDARHTIKEVYKIPDSDEDFKILMDQHWSRYPDKDKSIDHNFYYFIKSEIEHANRILANLLDATGASKNPSVPRVKEILEFEIRLEQYKDYLLHNHFLPINKESSETNIPTITKERAKPGRKKAQNLSNINLFDNCIKELTRKYLKNQLMREINLKKSKWKNYHYFLLWDELKTKGHIDEDYEGATGKQQVDIINKTFSEQTKESSFKRRNSHNTSDNYVKDTIPYYKKFEDIINGFEDHLVPDEVFKLQMGDSIKFNK